MRDVRVFTRWICEEPSAVETSSIMLAKEVRNER